MSNKRKRKISREGKRKKKAGKKEKREKSWEKGKKKERKKKRKRKKKGKSAVCNGLIIYTTTEGSGLPKCFSSEQLQSTLGPAYSTWMGDPGCP